MKHHENPERELDERLRRVLEPNPLKVERLVRTALSDDSRSTAAGNVWPRLAVAVALLLLAVVLIPRMSITPPPPVEPPPIVGEVVETPTPTPVRISISNADGYLTISSTAGPKWIVLPGDES
jgi:hypothetical protein